MWIPAKWRGTSRHPSTTRTTGIPPKLRFSSMRRSMGSTRKLVSTAARNGYFFTVDRVTGNRLSRRSMERIRTGRRDSGPTEPLTRSIEGSHHSGISRFTRGRWRSQLASPHTRPIQVSSIHGRITRSTCSISPTQIREDPWAWRESNRLVFGNLGSTRRFHHGDRSQDRQGRMAPQIYGGGGGGLLTTAGGISFLERRKRQLCGV